MKVDLPSHWQLVPLAKIATVQTGLAKGKVINGETIELPYLRVANVQDGYLDLREVKKIIKALHPAFSLSNRQVRILRPIIAPSAGNVFPRHVEITQCCPVRWQFIGHHLIRRISLLLEQFAHQLECCFLVPPGLNQDIQHLTLAVHRPP